MKLARVGVIAVAILAVATVAWAQKPDFSGTWTLDPASAPAGGGGGGRGGRRRCSGEWPGDGQADGRCADDRTHDGRRQGHPDLQARRH